jgi:serine/threonine protein kinase
MQATVYIVMERCPRSSPFPLLCDPSHVLVAAPGSANMLPVISAAEARRMRPKKPSEGDLFQYAGQVTKAGCKFVLKQLLVLLRYLHEPRECGSRVLHRDLKLENTLVWQWVGEYPYIKVADFGCARRISSGTLTFFAIFTPSFTAISSIWTFVYCCRLGRHHKGCRNACIYGPGVV